MNTQRLVLAGILLATATILSWAEQWIGSGLLIKIGLSNIVSMMVLCLYDAKGFLSFQFSKVFLSFLLSGGFGLSLWISLGGTLLSSLVLLLAFKVKGLSLYGLSALGAFFHVVGQACVVLMIYQQMGLIVWVPIFEVISLISSIIMATLARKGLLWILTNTSMVCKRSNVV